MSTVWWCGGSGVGLRLREGGGEGGKVDEERKGKESYWFKKARNKGGW